MSGAMCTFAHVPEVLRWAFGRRAGVIVAISKASECADRVTQNTVGSSSRARGPIRLRRETVPTNGCQCGCAASQFSAIRLCPQLVMSLIAARLVFSSPLVHPRIAVSVAPWSQLEDLWRTVRILDFESYSLSCGTKCQRFAVCGTRRQC